MATLTPYEPSAALIRVTASNCCAGCGLCASIAPKALAIQNSNDGFLRPHQFAALTAAEESTFAKTCPGISVKSKAASELNNEIDDHYLWGPTVAVRVGFSTDAALRRHASSGGAISALLTHLLHIKAVDFVVQVGPSTHSPIENEVFRNIDADAIYNSAGSRYAPSAPMQQIVQLLDLPEKFVLVGKPCDIAAARALARIDPRVDQKIPYMISFFCAGVPSRKGSVKILSALGLTEQEVGTFQYRGDGWPGFATARTTDGQTERMTYADSWGNILSKEVQFRCKICADGVGGQADVVCADAWECNEEGYPHFEETDGHSLIVSRTSNGEKLVREALALKVIEAKDFSIEAISTIQPSQAKRKRQVVARTTAMQVLGMKPTRYENLHIWRAACSAGLAENFRGFFGTLRRLVSRKI